MSRSTGYIVGDKYIKTKDIKIDKADIQATYKDWSHSRQRENHRADLVQPYRNGKINPEFEILYPDQTQQMKEG